MFQNKNCRNCHALEGIGGQRGPDLTTVGTRLTRDQLIDQVSNGTPGGGNMPAYGKQLNPAEMTTLAEFLVSLRPPGQTAGSLGRGWSVTEFDEAMDPTLDAFFRSWPFDSLALGDTPAVCWDLLRGWLVLQRRDAGRWRPGPRCFRGWLDSGFHSPGFADRAVRFLAPSGPYGAAPAADDGRAAAFLAGLATGTDAAGTARTGPRLLDRTAVALADDSPLLSAA